MRFWKALLFYVPFLASPAFAGDPVTIVDVTGSYAATVNSAGQLVIDCASGCSGGVGGNVTITGPLGAGADSVGVTVTLATSAQTSLNTIAAFSALSTVTPCSTATTANCTPAQLLQLAIQQYQAATPAGTNVIGYVSNDPCAQAAKLTAHFESTSSGGNFITGSSGKITYICSLAVAVSTQAPFSLCEATSTACSGGTPAAVFMNIGTTAANGATIGLSATAPGGMTYGNGGYTVAKTATDGQNVDVLFGTTNSPQVNVDATYVQQ